MSDLVDMSIAALCACKIRARCVAIDGRSSAWGGFFSSDVCEWFPGWKVSNSVIVDRKSFEIPLSGALKIEGLSL